MLPLGIDSRDDTSILGDGAWLFGHALPSDASPAAVAAELVLNLLMQLAPSASGMDDDEVRGPTTYADAVIDLIDTLCRPALSASIPEEEGEEASDGVGRAFIRGGCAMYLVSAHARGERPRRGNDGNGHVACRERRRRALAGLSSGARSNEHILGSSVMFCTN